MINITINDSNGSTTASINSNINISLSFGNSINATAMINLINSLSASFNTNINLAVDLQVVNDWIGDIELREDGTIAFRENNTLGNRE